MKSYLLVGVMGLALVGTLQAKQNGYSRNSHQDRGNHRGRYERVEVHRQNRYVCKPPVRRVVHRRPRRVVQVYRTPRRPVVIHTRPCPQPRRVEVIHTYPRTQPIEVVYTYPTQPVYDQVGTTCGQTSTPAYTTEGVQTETVIHSPSRDKVRRRNAILIAGAANEIFNKGERRQKDIRKGAIAATILNEILTR